MPGAAPLSASLRLAFSLLPLSGQKGFEPFQQAEAVDRLLPPVSYTHLNILLVCEPEVSPQAACGMLERMGLEKQHHQKPVCDLSGGMRRRVALARALLAKSDWLALDEPFKGLDEDTRTLAIRELLAQSRGKTVLVITHDEHCLLYTSVEHIKMMNIIAAPEGAALVEATYPDVEIYCAAMDEDVYKRQAESRFLLADDLLGVKGNHELLVGGDDQRSHLGIVSRDIGFLTAGVVLLGVNLDAHELEPLHALRTHRGAVDVYKRQPPAPSGTRPAVSGRLKRGFPTALISRPTSPASSLPPFSIAMPASLPAPAPI